MPPQIIGLRGEQANKQFALGDAPITFGRNPDNVVVLVSGRSSRHHAEIRRTGAEYVLADLGSSNGTYVNGQRLTAPYYLRPGDTFDIGDDTFRFDAPAPAVDKTLIATPVAISAPPTVSASGPPPPIYQPPARSTPTPAVAPRKGGISRTLLIVLGLVGLVLVVACVGGAVVLSRSVSSALTNPTSSTAAGSTRTPQPTTTGDAPTAAAGNTIPTREPVAGAADWTVLVYLDGDNNLEHDAITDFNEMERAGSTDHVNVVVEFDRAHQDDEDDDTSNGDWDTTKRFLVQQDDNRRLMKSKELADLGEQNMGDPQTLADFITWGVKQYPAQHYALVLWDHGSSWAGVAFDDTNGEKGISLPELDAALRTSQSQTGVERLDLIGFDACLMSQIDVLQTIAPYANVAVASAELEPNDGWAWDAWLKQLNQNSTEDAAAVGKSIVDSYQEYYTDSAHDTVTLSAFDLNKIGAVSEGLNTLSDAMIKDLGGSYQAIAQARSAADAYSQPQPETFSAVDLGDFTRLINLQGAKGDVAAAAEALSQRIDEARLAEWHSTFHDRSTGLSVFFPQVLDLYPDAYDNASPIPRDTSWAKFLKAFYETGGQQVSAPVIDNLDLSSPTVGNANPVTLQGQVTGKDIAYVFFFIGVPNSDRSGVELTDIDYVYPPGSSPNTEVPPWDDGANALSETWDGTRWALSNGTDSIPVLLGPTKYGTDLYGVEGIYTFKGSQEQISAGLLFKVNQGHATLQQINGFPTSQTQETQPFEITPSAGDTFTAKLRTYTIKDGRPVPAFNQGQTITLSDAPLSAALAPAENGDYVAGFLVRDIAGHFNYQYSDISVDNTGAAPGAPPAQQPTSGPGSAAGTLAYQSAEGKFTIEYPDAWQTLDTGKSEIYFYDPAETSQTFLDVQYLPVKQKPAQANLALLKSFQETLAQEQNYQHGDSVTVDFAGESGLSFKYSYTDKDGRTLTGIAVVVTSPRTKLGYVLAVQALTADFDSQADTSDKMLATFTIE